MLQTQVLYLLIEDSVIGSLSHNKLKELNVLLNTLV